MKTFFVSHPTRPFVAIFKANWLLLGLLPGSCLTSQAQTLAAATHVASALPDSRLTNSGLPRTHQTDEFWPLNSPPFFPGGPQALQIYLQNPALYPFLARQVLREGHVRVRFRVLDTGQLTQFQVVQSGGPVIDRGALRAVAQMPRWHPAHRDGAVVSCLYELPITFRLD